MPAHAVRAASALTRSPIACTRCHASKARCDFAAHGSPCSRCQSRGEHSCEAIASRRGKYDRAEWLRKRQLAKHLKQTSQFVAPVQVTTATAPAQPQDELHGRLFSGAYAMCGNATAESAVTATTTTTTTTAGDGAEDLFNHRDADQLAAFYDDSLANPPVKDEKEDEDGDFPCIMIPSELRDSDGMLACLHDHSRSHSLYLDLDLALDATTYDSDSVVPFSNDIIIPSSSDAISPLLAAGPHAGLTGFNNDNDPFSIPPPPLTPAWSMSASSTASSSEFSSASSSPTSSASLFSFLDVERYLADLFQGRKLIAAVDK
ncbi:uncharacterized protein V1518DRAFT_49842 [Limtongia smithiae]|uniref:uncharacterized protein n=1 Tax=Limtongia smithiae TaxID=1125753 RepID=UPI0034CEBD2D